MENTQKMCDRCGRLLYDKIQCVNHKRHACCIIFGYSRCGEWGLRDNLVNESYQHLCDKCWHGVVVITRLTEMYLNKNIGSGDFVGFVTEQIELVGS